MLKPGSIFCLITFALFSTHFSMAAAPGETNQEELTQEVARADQGDSTYQPVQTTITGEVTFEFRYTKVHDENSASGYPSQQSQKYWTLVVVSGEKRYVLNEKLNVGAELAPESIELAGSRIKPGSVVSIVGEVLMSAPSYLMILDIQSLRVLSEASL